MKPIKLMTLFALTLALTSCGSDEEKQSYAPEKNIEISRAESEAMDNIANFSLKIFKTAYEENKNNGNGNFVIAPFNLATSLAMVVNATYDEQVKQELLSLFDIQSEEMDDLNRMFEKILTEIPGLDPKSDLLLANSVWTDIDTVVPEWYVEKMESHFKASVNVVEDMKSTESVDRINQWIESATNGLFDFKVDYSGFLNEYYNIKHFVALNAMYFKGQWREKFDKSKTEPRIFYNADGTTSKPMTMESYVKIYRDGCYDDNSKRYLGPCVRMPYGNNSFAMNIFMPEEYIPMDDFIEYLCDGGWMSYENSRRYENKCLVDLPRFEINNVILFDDILLKNGLDLKRPDFENPRNSGITLFGDGYKKMTFNANQKTILKVDEEGSEAISITHSKGSSKYPTSAGPTWVAFDHPFIFVLSERSTGAILVAGCVNKL